MIKVYIGKAKQKVTRPPLNTGFIDKFLLQGSFLKQSSSLKIGPIWPCLSMPIRLVTPLQSTTVKFYSPFYEIFLAYDVDDFSGDLSRAGMATKQDRGPEEEGLPGKVFGQGGDPAGSCFRSGFVRLV